MMILVHKWSYLRISNIRNIADGGGKCEPTQQIIPEIFATSRFHDNATKINVPPHSPQKNRFYHSLAFIDRFGFSFVLAPTVSLFPSH